MQNPFIPQTTDAAWILLHMIFGDVVNPMASGSTTSGSMSTAATMLAAAFRYFDSGVLVFGALIMTGVTVFGVSNSANDGEVLGKTWNTFYTPIRTVSAAAALIPSSSGYATVQITLLYVVAWSIGFASNLWTNVVQAGLATDITQTALNSVVDDANFNSVMTQAIRMGTCAAAMNKAMASLGQTTTLVWSVTNLEDTHLGTKTVGSKYFYSDPNVPGSGNLCGSISLTDTQPVLSNLVAAGTAFSPTGNNKAAQTLRTALWNARNQFYMATFNSWVPAEVSTIMSAADNGTSLSATTLATDLANYKTQLTQQIQNEVSSSIGNENSDLVSQMTSQGWIMAGSYWMDMGKLKDIIRSSSNSTIETADAGTAEVQAFFGSGDMYNSVASVVTKYQVLATEWTQKALANPASASSDPNAVTTPSLQSSFTLNDFTGGGMSVREIFVRVFNYLPNLFVRSIVAQMGKTDDPVMMVKNIGDTITTLANAYGVWKGVTLATLTGVEKTAESSSIPGTSVVAGVVAGVAAWFAEMFSLIKPSLYTILYAGYWLGIWIPMVPFYVFTIGVVGWLIFVMEMMAAGMLWAAAHTTPARDNSFIGSQIQGYMLVMSGFFRPALMVLGLVGSNALLAPVVAFINTSFLARFESMTANSLTMISSVAGYLVIYAFFINTSFMLIFGLPQSLPDRILRWLGAGIGDLGERETSGKLENAASGTSRSAMVKGIQLGEHQRAAQEKAEQDAARERAAQAQRDIESQRHDDIVGALRGSRQNAPMTDTGPIPPIDKPA